MPNLTEILAQLVCPACLGSLADEQGQIVCIACGRSYPVRDGIPVLIIEQSTPKDC